MQGTLQNSTATNSPVKIGPTRILLLDRAIPYDFWSTIMIMLSIVIGSLLGYGAARMARPRRLPATPFLLALMLTTTTEIGADLVWAAIHHPPALAMISTTAPSLPKLYAKNCSARLPCIPDIPLTIKPIRFDLPITNDVVIFSTVSYPSCHLGSCIGFLPFFIKWHDTSLMVKLSAPFLYPPECSGKHASQLACRPRAAMHTRPDFPTCPYRVSPSRKRQMVDLSQLSWQPCTVDGVGVTYLNMSWWSRFSLPRSTDILTVTGWESQRHQYFDGAVTWWEPYKEISNNLATSFPFPLNENWLCLSTGACMDLRPVLAINASASNGTTNVTLNSEAACVKPPYLWVFSVDITFKCSNQSCFTGNCWNGSFPYAMLALRPPLMWVPFNESVWVHPVYQQDQLPMLRHKRDFGITAALAALFVTLTATAVTAAVALTQSTLTAQAFANLTDTTSLALREQQEVNLLQHNAIMALQQQIDLIAQEVQGLWEVANNLCDARWAFTQLCVTPIQVNRSAYKQFQDYVLTTYNSSFWNASVRLDMTIRQLDQIEVPILTASFFDDVLGQIGSFFKPSSLLVYGIILVLMVVALVTLRCLRSIRTTQKTHMALMILLAQSQGDSTPSAFWAQARKARLQW
ncbi:uncharacterized protein LOC134475299 [Cavia porcellus]|uniref:uncharacterized protein LOC134475299 n=1 Tax=Cavia porcellus TaxID=10141 RepID=UPI002FE2828B